MQNHDSYLQQIEDHLKDLPVLVRSKIILEVSEHIQTIGSEELQSALHMANLKRSEHGYTPYVEKKEFSFFKFFMKGTLIMSFVSVIFVSFLVWKFTPLFHVDEKTNRIVILGGLIDINGEAGKVKVFDQYQYSDSNFSDDFTANFTLNEEQDEVILEFQSGSFQLSTSAGSSFNLDCKLASPPDKKIISEKDDFIKIDLTQIQGSSCKLEVPEDKKITLEGEDAEIKLISPRFNSYTEITNGKVAITPAIETDYQFDLEVKEGYLGEFESSDDPEAFEIRVQIDNGSIITK